MIQSAISQSINRIDTASMYGFGRAESLVGKTISHNRPQIILSTKFGLALEQQELYASTVERHAVILHWNVAPSSIGFIKACAEGRRRNFYNVRLAVWFGSVQHCTCTRLKQNDVGQAFWNRTIEDIDTISAAPLSCALITTVPLCSDGVGRSFITLWTVEDHPAFGDCQMGSSSLVNIPCGGFI